MICIANLLVWISVEKLQAEIKKHSERIKEIKEIIESRKTNAKSVPSGRSDIMRRLSTLRDEFQQVLVSSWVHMLMRTNRCCCCLTSHNQH